MATFSGNDGVVKVGANEMAEVMSFTVNYSAETIDATSMGARFRKKLAGLRTWDGTIEVRWDDTDTNVQEALQAKIVDAQTDYKVALELYPEGDATGAYKISGNVFITGVSQTQSYDNTTVTRTFTFEGESTPTVSTVSA